MAKVKGVTLVAVLAVAALFAVMGDLPKFDHSPSSGLRKVVVTVTMDKQHVDINYALNFVWLPSPEEVRGKYEWRRVFHLQRGTTVQVRATQSVDRSLSCFIQVVGKAEGWAATGSTAERGEVYCHAIA